ncbi:sialate O-acetylesterase [Haloferula sp. A504]|uniref:sialate O-acetylesterase n=1 Tax=Haloferula sp. A504 TaxID=3373601 RepID=UPI0031C002C4|nr:sialate O-acetylesterase [Verrucomicrobiaceae bacterium E54]
MTTKTDSKPSRALLGRQVILPVLSLLSGMALAADVIPVDLPAPDPADKGASNKPVKVYILSGQSNMLGFGKVEGSTPFYSSVFLSADPSATPCKLSLNKSNAAMVPLKLYKHADAGSEAGAVGFLVGMEIPAPNETKVNVSNVHLPAFGSSTLELPATEANQILEVKTFVEVPFDGSYRIHPAGAREVKVDDAVVEEGSAVKLTKGKRHELAITYAKGGGSGALWMEKVDLEGMGDLRWAVEKLGRFPYLLDEKGEWTVRHDVMLNDAYMGKGKSDPLSAPACGPSFGPELGFGYVMGEFHDEPVIVMKADIGNRSLGWDILPPGSESYTYEGTNYPGYKEQLDADGKVVKWDGEGWYAGKQYDEYTAAIRAVLDNFDEKYPEYADQGFEVAGFVWWQGHKDGPNPGHNANYEKNLVNLIKAWRKEFEAPEAKWAIATVGFEGENMPEHYVKILEAQKAVADPERHPDLAGTVKTIDTRPFWRGPEVSPKNQNYHYHHNGETYMLTGDALGRAMVELHGGEVEYPDGAMDPSVTAIPDMELATNEQFEKMRDALRPIVLDKLIPEYVAGAPGTPVYRRGGLAIENIINATPPEKPTPQLRSQFDQLLELYEMAGIEDYSWKRFGPEMQTAEWAYLTFDPAEKKESPEGDRYREVTLPKGSEDWTAPGFDPTKAGWKTGKAPFGQKDGRQEALIAGCRVPHCGCHITPNTLWDKEVLLMRQTFKVPAFEDGKRYRIIVGGAGHGWSGEGFALHVNGKPVSEMTGGYYKGGGAARGVYLFGDLAGEVSGKEVTIALKGFLRQNGHKNKPAAPSGHLSVWLEEATLPPSVAEMAEE